MFDSYLASHWLPLALTGLGLVLWGLRRRSLLSLAIILTGIGGLTWPAVWGKWTFIAAAGGLTAMFIGVVVSGVWSAALGYGLAAILLFGLGAWVCEPLARSLAEAYAFLLSLGVDEPWWLLGLLLVPLLVWVSYGRLAGLGPVRSRLALAMRCVLVVFICLALAEVHARQVDHDVTVLFVIDRSLSIPTEFVKGNDVRQERIFKFINQAVKNRGPGGDGHRTGVIVFGRFPRLELPPARVAQLPIKNLQSVVDQNYTDIAAALKLALASFPEGSSKRIVLISDGNENLGNAIEQARLARTNGVQIDAVAIAAGRHNLDEVMVERVEAPLLSSGNSKIPIKVVLRSYYPGVVIGQLSLLRTIVKKDPGKDEFYFDTESVLKNKQPIMVRLHEGLNVIPFQQEGLKADAEWAVTYLAQFVPIGRITPEGKTEEGKLPGDREENNQASTTVISRGDRAVLLIESLTSNDADAEARTGDHHLLAERLRQGGGPKVVRLRTDSSLLSQNPAELAMFLSRFDCIILANVPADELSDAQQSVIRSNTHEQGAGLIMIGGPQSFGAGGWQNTELEKALPVTCDNKSTKIDVPGGLVLVMHASEMLDGNGWQKKVAKLAIEKLSPIDMLGMTYYGELGHTWHIPFKTVGGERADFLRKVDAMNPGDMPDLEASLTMARSELNKPKYDLGTKHVIFISDGDTSFPNDAYLRQMGREGITLTTVCITSHGLGEVTRMAEIVQKVVTPGGKIGRYYHVKNPRDLPAIYMKETRMVSQSFVYQKPFDPKVVRRDGPVGNMENPPPLHGFVRTTRRPTNLVQVAIETPRLGEEDYPVLAYWNYGLGRAVAFTSDARSSEAAQYWDRDWAGSKNSTHYTRFWKQIVEWASRPRDADQQKFLTVTTDQRGGKVRVIVEALHPTTHLPINVELQPGATALSFAQKEARRIDLKFEPKGGGIYEAEFPADEVGSFLLNIKGTWPDSPDANKTAMVRAAVTVPYSPELSEMESRPELLHKLAEMTGGQVYEEDDDVLSRAAASGELYRPVATNQRSLQPLWWLLVMLTGLGMFLDVAVRRISIEPAAVSRKLQDLWAGLRGQAAQEGPADPFMERLKSRKAQVEDALAREKGARRFDAPPAAPPPPPSAGDAPPPAPSPVPKPQPPPPSVAPQKEAEAADYASRLMRAKKRAQEDRDKK